MTAIQGPTEVINTVKAKNGLPFPVVEDTDVWGGYQTVASLAERDAIPDEKLKLNMMVAVQADGKRWELVSLSPKTWTEFVDVATHAAQTSGVHGISPFGATLIDDTNPASARTTLGLGTAATQNISSGTAPPSGGADGDIYLQYT